MKQNLWHVRLTDLIKGDLSAVFFFISAIHPQWIPYAIMGSTVISFPLMLLVQEQYNRASLDQAI